MSRIQHMMGNTESPNKGWLISALGLSPLLLPVILLLPSLTSFPYPGGELSYSDISLAHYPNAVFLRQSLWVDRTIPLWSPLILSGAPFAANPLSGLWYPPGWLALILPLPLAFNLLVSLHLLWGGLGGYCLLRSEGLSHKSSILAALAFSFMPKLFAHYGAGHLTLLYAVPWTPWLLFASRQESEGASKAARWWEAVIFALIILADVRWGVYAGLCWWFYSLVIRQANRMPGAGWWSTANPKILRLVKKSFLALLLASPLLVPLLEFTRLTTRANMSVADKMAFSLPVSRLLGLFFPDFAGFHEWTLYPGVMIFALCLLAGLWGSSRSKGKVWVWLALLSLVFSLGSNLPFLPILARLPGLSWLRVPSRALFLTGFSLAMLSAYALDFLLKGVTNAERRGANLVLTALLAFATTLTLGSWIVTGNFPTPFAWASGMLLVGALWVNIRMREKASAGIFYLGLFAICLLDWVAIDSSLFSSRGPDSVFAEGNSLAEQLTSYSGNFRIYSPSYSLPQQTAANFSLQLADGVDPLQLASYGAFMEQASGVPGQGYSVTLPPYASGYPRQDNATYEPNPEMLGWLNVRFIAAEFRLEVEGLELRWQEDETLLYENHTSMPRVWVQPAGSPLGHDIQEAHLLNWSPNRIEISASGPGMLVLSEIDYPGWRAWVDEVQVEIQPVAGLFRAFDLGREPGDHHVTFKFQPLSVYLGLLLSSLGLAFLFGRIFLEMKIKREAGR